MINVFDVVYKRLVAELRAAWGWIMTGEIPVALVVWNRLAQAPSMLWNTSWIGVVMPSGRSISTILVDFLGAEWLVDGAYRIDLLLLWLCQFCLASLIGLLDKVFHLALFQKLDGSTEHAELFRPCHIDTIITDNGSEG